MKRRLLALLLAVLTLTMLTAAAFAADATEAGAYYIRTEAGYTLTVKDAASDGGFYKGASKFKLSCENLPGQYSLVFLINTDTAQTTTVVRPKPICIISIRRVFQRRPSSNWFPSK